MLMATAAPQVRHRLGRWRTVLNPTGTAVGHGPVDPDAIVLLPNPHDRL